MLHSRYSEKDEASFRSLGICSLSNISVNTRFRWMTSASNPSQHLTYRRLVPASPFSSTFNLLFLGCGLWTKVQSCLWKSHNVQLATPSPITHRLFLLRQASQGRSRRERVLVASATVAIALDFVTPFSAFGPLLRAFTTVPDIGAGPDDEA